MTPRQLRRWVRRMCDTRDTTVDRLCRDVGISKPQLYRYINGRDERGRVMKVPLKFRLAFAAYELGVRDFDGETIIREPVARIG